MKKSLAKKLSIYSVIGAVGGMTFGSSVADADVIFTDFDGGPATLAGDAVEIDIDNNGDIDFVFDIRSDVVNTYFSFSNWALINGEGNNQFVAIDPSPFDAGPDVGPNNLAYGGLVSAAQTFAAGGDNGGPLQFAYRSYNTANFYGAFGGLNFPGNGNSGYIGVQFEGDGGNTYFGWINVSVEGDLTNNGVDSASIVIDSFAYEDNGGAIRAGSRVSIPEPTSLGLLALGAAGVAARRRKNS